MKVFRRAASVALLASAVFVYVARAAPRPDDPARGGPPDLRLTSVSESQDEAAAEGSDPQTPPRRSAPPRGDWTFELSPYFWAMSLRAEVDGAVSEACFTDLVGHLDFGAMMRFEGRHSSRWGFYLEGMYLSLGDDAKVHAGPFRFRGIDVDATFTQADLDFGGMYRFGDDALALDVLFGGRYTHLETKLDLGPLPERNNNIDFVAPVVGGRVRFDLGEKWLLSVKADVGGFSVDEAPDLTWGVTSLLGYRLRERAVLGFGYRYYDTGSDDGGTDADLIFHGPIIGLAWSF